MPQKIPISEDQRQRFRPVPQKIPLGRSTRQPITAANVDHEAFAEAEFRRATAPGGVNVQGPKEPDVPLTTRALGSVGGMGRELLGMPWGMLQQASVLVDPTGSTLHKTAAGTEQAFGELRAQPLEFAAENPLTTFGIVTAPAMLAPLKALTTASATGTMRALPAVPKQRLLPGAPRELPPAPPIRGGRVTAEFVDDVVVPRTYQPARPALPAGSERLLPPVPTRGGTVNAEFVGDVPPRTYQPPRAQIGTSIRGELTAGPGPRKMLPPGQTIELPDGGGVMRPPKGEPGGIPARPEATITPTAAGVVPRTAQKIPLSMETRKALVSPERAALPQGDRGVQPMAPSPTLPIAKSIELRPGPSKPKLGATESEAMTLAGRGRRPELLKEGKVFDQEALVKSELFGGKGGPQQFLETDVRAEVPPPKPADVATPYLAAVDEAARMRLQNFLQEAKSGTSELTGKKMDQSNRSNWNYEASSVIPVGRIGGGLKEAWPELKHFNESPGRIAEAIIRDKDNPLYKRILEASKAYVEDVHGDEIAKFVNETPDPDSDISFNFGPETGAVRAADLARPVHTVRQLAFEAGERIGQPIVDAIGSAFTKMVPASMSESLKTKLGPIADWVPTRENLGIGEFGRQEGLRAARRKRAGDMRVLTEDALPTIADMLHKSLPTPESQVLAAKIARNELSPADLAKVVAENPEINAAAQFVQQQFMKTAERFVAEGVGQYAKLDPTARQHVIAAMKGDIPADALGPALRPFIEHGVAKYFGEYLPRLYKSKEAKAVLKKYDVNDKQIRIGLDRLKKRQDIPENVRLALGEIEEISYPALKGIYQERQMLINNEFFNKIATDPTLAAASPEGAPATWKPLPVNDGLGALSGKTVSPAVYRDVMGIVDAPRHASEVLRDANRFVKMNKTVRNPGTHVRNVMSNYMLRDMFGMDFVDQARFDYGAVVDYARNSEAFQEARQAGLFGTDFVVMDLKGADLAAFSRLPVATDSIAASMTTLQKMTDMLKKLYKGEDASTKIASALYRLEDEIPKLGMYKYYRGKGMSPEMAVERTSRALPDYSDVSPLVETARRSILGPTFVTWTAKVVPAVAENLIKHPLRTGKYVVLGKALEQLSSYLLGETEEERKEAAASLPEYMRPKAGVFTPFARLPLKDRFGQDRYYDLSYTLPFGDIAEQTGLAGLPSVFNVGILPMTAMELVMNQNRFMSVVRGEPVPLWEGTDTAMESVGKAAMHVGRQTLPSLTPGIGYGAERLRTAIPTKEFPEGRPNYYGQVEPLPYATAHVLGGMKTVPVERGLEQQKQVMRVQAQLTAFERQISSIGRNASLSDSQKAAEVEKIRQKMQRLMDQYQQDSAR